MHRPVRSGLDVLQRQEFTPLRGKRIGLVTHPAAVTADLRPSVSVFANAPNLNLVTVFGPEHGVLGHAQDLVAVRGAAATPAATRVVSLYGESLESLQPTTTQLDGLDALVIDLQDVGARYYTFQATMLLCLKAAAAVRLPVWVLDRPNPLGGEAIEGPTILPGFDSFVGIHPVPTRHGLTIGELALMYRHECRLEVELTVVPCEGWRRKMHFDETGLPWVMTSPNMPTLETAFVYPGQCLLEGTNLSEGRGTTRPFELCGAPNIDAEAVATRLSSLSMLGVSFRPVRFQPMFQKHTSAMCGGVQLHVTDRRSFSPVRTGLAVLCVLREHAGASFDWRRETYEFVSDRLAIDLLFGSPRERLAIESGESIDQIVSRWTADESAFRERRMRFLLYD